MSQSGAGRTRFRPFGVRASNNSYELLNIHHVFGPGLFINGAGGNLIVNCDSHDNYDKNGSQGDGQNGDGFGVHYQRLGRARSFEDAGHGGTRTTATISSGKKSLFSIENSWAANGYADGGTTKPSSGNGNGFKAGSSKTGIRHTLQHSLAWKNKAAGFYANHSSGGNTWYNNTSYNKAPPSTCWPALPVTLTSASSYRALAHMMRNNVGFPDANANMGGVDPIELVGLEDHPADSDSSARTTRASWGRDNPMEACRATDFLKLKAGSQLIDKGTDVGLKFVGASPDLGADEYGAQPGGAGGAPPKSDAGAGSSGSTGSGGATRDGGGGGATSDAGAGGAGAEITSGAGGTAGSAGVEDRREAAATTGPRVGAT